jgi:hypothetical protein
MAVIKEKSIRTPYNERSKGALNIIFARYSPNANAPM